MDNNHSMNNSITKTLVPLVVVCSLVTWVLVVACTKESMISSIIKTMEAMMCDRRKSSNLVRFVIRLMRKIMR